MDTVISRAGRWPLALTFAALAVVAACSDEPVAPNSPSTLAPKAACANYSASPTTIASCFCKAARVFSSRWSP